jgi:hypothetical protein
MNAIDLGLPTPEVFPQDGVTTEEYFGGCPHCGANDGLYNTGKAHWFVCHKHKTIWFGGINLFSIAKMQTEAEQREIWKRVERYRHAKPVYPDPEPADLHTADGCNVCAWPVAKED